MLPYISDNQKDVQELIEAMVDNKTDYVIVDLLNFRGDARDRYMTFLREHNPELISKYKELYQTDYCDKKYATKIRNHVAKLIKLIANH